MRPLARSNRELSVTLASTAGLELFWAVVALGSALVGIVGDQPLLLAVVAAIASSFALLARSGELAARFARDTETPAISMNLIAALGALTLSVLALMSIAPGYLAPLSMLVLAGILILDAPFEPELAAPRGGVAGGIMVVGGLAAIIVLASAFSARDGVPVLMPWAAAIIATAQLVGAAAVLIRHARG